MRLRPHTLSGFMTPSLLALSLSSSFTQIGAIAAFAALVGIAVLSLLFFSQARELKRLREWAGRAPERAADLEQRVSAEAAARVQQPGPSVQAVRPVARAEPINARAVSAAGPATRVASAAPARSTPAVPAQSSGQGAPAGQAVTAAGATPSPPLPSSPG